MNRIQALVLAGGKGKRINAKEIPKTLYPVLGKPMILYSLKTLAKVGFLKPIVVIGFCGEKIKQLLGDKVTYVWQRQ